MSQMQTVRRGRGNPATTHGTPTIGAHSAVERATQGQSPIQVASNDDFHHDFSKVPTLASTHSPLAASKRLNALTHQPTFGVNDVRAISASGTGTVATSYVPEASDKSTKIVFIQVMRELLDSAPTKPGLILPGFAYQDKDTTADLFHVDYVNGEKDPYYNGDDAQDFGTQGNAQLTPKVAASTTDTPSLGDGSIPAGHTTVDYEFRTAAFSAAGADAGTFYGFVDWAFQKERGKASTTKIGSTSNSSPGSKFTDAVKLFSANHGFSLPGGSGGASLAGGLVGAGIGGIAGAAIGTALGGPVGAIVGGLVGLAAGGIIGALS